MTLIKSISGIRGTIGGAANDNLTPIDCVKFTASYVKWLVSRFPNRQLKVVLGRDARLSGELVANIVEGTLLGCGVDVINVGLCTTPGVEMAVIKKGADGGIILTASHNPKEWNALKLLNNSGEFLSAADGAEILKYVNEDDFTFATIDNIGKVIERSNFDDEHIDAVLNLPLVDVELVKSKKFKVVVDAVNSVGGVVIPKLLERMGVEVIKLNCEPTGNFAHNPEPIPDNLTQIREVVAKEGADLGVVVDPDVDRLALVCESGEMFGEEYTLVSVADYVLSKTPGNTVSNLSSSRALRDVTLGYGASYSAAAVGEVNVTAKMKETNAVIGGEGNGGVIYPELHYGRDALVGVALFLTHLAIAGVKVSKLKERYPQYMISKKKFAYPAGIDDKAIYDMVKGLFAGEQITDIDGVKVDFDHGWVHFRKSNTEPIVRVYGEAKDMESADTLTEGVIEKIEKLLK